MSVLKTWVDSPPDRRQANRNIDGGRTFAPGRRRRQAARAPTHVGRQRSDPTETAPLVLPAGVRDALPRRQGSLRHASAAREGRQGQSSLRHLVRRRPAHDRHQQSGESQGARLLHSKTGGWRGRAADQGCVQGRPRLLWVTDKERGLEVIEYKN
jgi:hypothetical protein